MTTRIITYLSATVVLTVSICLILFEQDAGTAIKSAWLGLSQMWWFLFWLVTAVMLVVVFAIGRRHWKKCWRIHWLQAVCIAGAVYAGVFSYGQNARFIRNYERKADLSADNRQAVEALGTIYRISKTEESVIYDLKHTYLKISNQIYSCNHLKIYAKETSYALGNQIYVKGVLMKFRTPQNEGGFHEAVFARAQKQAYRMYASETVCVKVSTNQVMQSLMQMKEQIKSVYQSRLKISVGSVLSGMVLGDKTWLEEEQKELYQEAGISHILAISGMHVSIIGLMLVKVFSKCGKRVSRVIASSGIVFYLLFSGMAISAIRAGVMFVVMQMSVFPGRKYDSLTALSFVALVQVLSYPYIVQYIGFQFSYLAVLGVILIGQPLMKWIKEKVKCKRIMREILEMGSISLSIQLMLVPLLMYYNYEISLWTIVVNVFVLPFAGVLLICGLFGGVFGAVASMMSGSMEWIACGIQLIGDICFLPCRGIVWGYEKICVFSTALPGSHLITGKPSSVQMLLAYVLLFMSIWLVYKWQKKFWIVVMQLFVCVIPAIHIPPAFEVTALSVGQGDGIYLHTDAGHDCFIDGGSTSETKVGKYQILPFLKAKAVREIDYWFVSHADEDHISGLKEVIASGYQIKTIVLAYGIVEDEAVTALVAMAKQHEMEVYFMQQREVFAWDDTTITALYPPNESASTDRNENSLTLLVRDGDFCGVFGGDIAKEQEKYIADTYDLEDVTLWKASHHGSKYSNSEELLQELSPQVCIISCGERNRYGHPHAEAIERMRQYARRIYRTDECGQITIRKDRKERMSIRCGT